jgi:hypothetical protein
MHISKRFFDQIIERATASLPNKQAKKQVKPQESSGYPNPLPTRIFARAKKAHRGKA